MAKVVEFPAIDDLLSVAQVAEILGVSRWYVYMRTGPGCRRNPLPCSRIGRLVRFKRSDVAKWVAEGLPE